MKSDMFDQAQSLIQSAWHSRSTWVGWSFRFIRPQEETGTSQTKILC